MIKNIIIVWVIKYFLCTLFIHKYEVFALNFFFSPIGVVPGQQNSPQPQFIIQPHGMPMAAVQTVGQAGGQGTPVGGAPGVGGQMQGPPGGPGQ